jgi:dienelactone hydrolase
MNEVKLNAEASRSSAALCKEKYIASFGLVSASQCLMNWHPVLIAFGLSLAAHGAYSQSAQQPISLSGPGALQIKAWHFEPAQAKPDERRPVVIALHGCGGLYATQGQRKGLLNARHQAMGEMLQAQGYHVIFPDSLGSRGVQSICSEVERLKNGITIGMNERRADALAALAWVRSQPWADPARVALLGWSHGAQTVLAVTDRAHPAVKGIEPFKTAIAFYPGCVNAQRDNYRTNTSLTLLLGADDDWTLPEPCIRMAARLQKAGDAVTLKVYEGAVHGFDTPVAGVRERSDIPSRKPNAKASEGVKAGQNPAVRDVLRTAFAAN